MVVSMWGNTRAVAQAVAEGLSECVPARVVEVKDATALGGHTSLLVVGGPTQRLGVGAHLVRTRLRPR